MVGHELWMRVPNVGLFSRSRVRSRFSRMSRTVPWRLSGSTLADMVLEGTQSKLDLLRVDHTGGFRKPDSLRDAYVRFAQGEVAEAEVRRIQDEAIRALI